MRRSAQVFADRPAVIFGTQSWTWSQFSARCHNLAGALAGAGLQKGETVSILADNIPAALEACYGIPMAGGIINAINTRLDAEAVAFIIEHAEARVFLVDRHYSQVVGEAIAKSSRDILVVDIEDAEAGSAPEFADCSYEDFLKTGAEATLPEFDLDELDPIALNYTSGTTGDPKGVLLHHRGAYLNSVGNSLAWEMPRFCVYLWSLPLFHCNGWCFPWTIALQGGVNVCVRGVDPQNLLSLIDEHSVTHLCGAPIVVRMLVDAADAANRTGSAPLSIMTAGAAPPSALLEKAQASGFEITHTYGLTEVYGPCSVCEWLPEWDELPADDQAVLKARQGVGYPMVEEVAVLDPETMQPVPQDGETIGEVMFRGNVVMSEYYKNPQATESALAGGYFHSGDLAVWHQGGYVEIKDRSKDIIISGGENISSIEVEGVLYKHPAVSAAAVVAAPHEKWGETPHAFIETAQGKDVTPSEIIEFCRDRLAHFKCPTRVTVQELPKTATGKIQKYELREKAKAVEPAE
ncbi:acyl-CoA synthetase [Aurantiacibacter atlanticus]|uniref:3-methylmercaptopropionyl-CoA ligase n=1 Tax=Aurantiacibacter atlanticus TaxID=1648404 RepID=A0A0H4VFH8_9SPHN|nr:acyl-CoA synthetase [Aurantiacibacter atlanticus]